MRIIKFAILFIFICAVISCSWSEVPEVNSPVDNTSVNAPQAADETGETDTKPPVQEKFEVKEVYPVESYSRNSPTDTMKTFAKATINNDAEGVKKTLSEGSLKMIAESAKNQGVSIDAILLTKNENSLTEVPEMKNEKIEGNTATVDVKNRVTKEFEKMPLVKENGEWKLALDKFMEETMKKLREEMKAPLPKSQENK